MQTNRLPRRAVARLNGTDTPLMLITSKGFNAECVITDDAKNKAGICIHVSFNDVPFWQESPRRFGKGTNIFSFFFLQLRNIFELESTASHAAIMMLINFLFPCLNKTATKPPVYTYFCVIF